MKKIAILLFTFCLIVYCSKDDGSNSPSNEIITYRNIQLGGPDLQNDVGGFFSTSTGKIIKQTRCKTSRNSLD